MNKKLIKKYKKEFDWWLNGGRIASYNTLLYEAWVDDISKHIWSSTHKNILIVINDEYVEFRKALAKGKIVQYSPKENIKPFWQEFKYKTFSEEYVYRIKPKEPKFKIGDWVKNIKNKKIYRIDKQILKTRTQYLELWEPQKDEWCLFWNEYDEEHMCEFHKVPLLLRFESKINNSYAVREFDRNWFDHCIPFTGTLPINLQEKDI